MIDAHPDIIHLLLRHKMRRSELTQTVDVLRLCL
jgi:hypothetical protein